MCQPTVPDLMTPATALRDARKTGWQRKAHRARLRTMIQSGDLTKHGPMTLTPSARDGRLLSPCSAENAKFPSNRRSGACPDFGSLAAAALTHLTQDSAHVPYGRPYSTVSVLIPTDYRPHERALKELRNAERRSRSSGAFRANQRAAAQLAKAYPGWNIIGYTTVTMPPSG
jgi:hypothetical protein